MCHLCTVFFLRCACCVLIVKSISPGYLLFISGCQLGPTRGLQEDSDVAESDACSEVSSEEDDGVKERLELILDPLSCQETSENE